MPFVAKTGLVVINICETSLFTHGDVELVKFNSVLRIETYVCFDSTLKKLTNN